MHIFRRRRKSRFDGNNSMSSNDSAPSTPEQSQEFQHQASAQADKEAPQSYYGARRKRGTNKQLGALSSRSLEATSLVNSNSTLPTLYGSSMSASAGEQHWQQHHASTTAAASPLHASQQDLKTPESNHATVPNLQSSLSAAIAASDISAASMQASYGTLSNASTWHTSIGSLEEATRDFDDTRQDSLLWGHDPSESSSSSLLQQQQNPDNAQLDESRANKMQRLSQGTEEEPTGSLRAIRAMQKRASEHTRSHSGATQLLWHKAVDYDNRGESTEDQQNDINDDKHHGEQDGSRLSGFDAKRAWLEATFSPMGGGNMSVNTSTDTEASFELQQQPEPQVTPKRDKDRLATLKRRRPTKYIDCQDDPHSALYLQWFQHGLLDWKPTPRGWDSSTTLDAPVVARDQTAGPRRPPRIGTDVLPEAGSAHSALLAFTDESERSVLLLSQDDFEHQAAELDSSERSASRLRSLNESFYSASSNSDFGYTESIAPLATDAGAFSMPPEPSALAKKSGAKEPFAPEVTPRHTKPAPKPQSSGPEPTVVKWRAGSKGVTTAQLDGLGIKKTDGSKRTSLQQSKREFHAAELAAATRARHANAIAAAVSGNPVQRSSSLQKAELSSATEKTVLSVSSDKHDDATSSSFSNLPPQKKFNAAVNVVQSAQAIRRRQSERKSSEIMGILKKNSAYPDDRGDQEDEEETRVDRELVRASAAPSAPAITEIDNEDNDEVDDGDSSYGPAPASDSERMDDPIALDDAENDVGSESSARESDMIDETAVSELSSEVSSSSRTFRAGVLAVTAAESMRRRESERMSNRLMSAIKNNKAFLEEGLDDDDAGDGADSSRRKRASAVSAEPSIVEEDDDYSEEEVSVSENAEISADVVVVAQEDSEKDRGEDMASFEVSSAVSSSTRTFRAGALAVTAAESMRRRESERMSNSLMSALKNNRAYLQEGLDDDDADDSGESSQGLRRKRASAMSAEPSIVEEEDDDEDVYSEEEVDHSTSESTGVNGDGAVEDESENCEDNEIAASELSSTVPSSSRKFRAGVLAVGTAESMRRRESERMSNSLMSALKNNRAYLEEGLDDDDADDGGESSPGLRRKRASAMSAEPSIVEEDDDDEDVYSEEEVDHSTSESAGVNDQEALVEGESENCEDNEMEASELSSTVPSSSRKFRAGVLAVSTAESMRRRESERMSNSLMSALKNNRAYLEEGLDDDDADDGGESSQGLGRKRASAMSAEPSIVEEEDDDEGVYSEEEVDHSTSESAGVNGPVAIVAEEESESSEAVEMVSEYSSSDVLFSSTSSRKFRAGVLAVSTAESMRRRESERMSNSLMSALKNNRAFLEEGLEDDDASDGEASQGLRQKRASAKSAEPSIIEEEDDDVFSEEEVEESTSDDAGGRSAIVAQEESEHDEGDEMTSDLPSVLSSSDRKFNAAVDVVRIAQSMRRRESERMSNSLMSTLKNNRAFLSAGLDNDDVEPILNRSGAISSAAVEEEEVTEETVDDDDIVEILEEEVVDEDVTEETISEEEVTEETVSEEDVTAVFQQSLTSIVETDEEESDSEELEEPSEGEVAVTQAPQTLRQRGVDRKSSDLTSLLQSGDVVAEEFDDDEDESSWSNAQLTLLSGARPIMKEGKDGTDACEEVEGNQVAPSSSSLPSDAEATSENATDSSQLLDRSQTSISSDPERSDLPSAEMKAPLGTHAGTPQDESTTMDSAEGADSSEFEGKWSRAFSTVQAANSREASVAPDVSDEPRKSESARDSKEEPMREASAEKKAKSSDFISPETATDSAAARGGQWGTAINVVRAANAFKSSESQTRRSIRVSPVDAVPVASRSDRSHSGRTGRWMKSSTTKSDTTASKSEKLDSESVLPTGESGDTAKVALAQVSTELKSKSQEDVVLLNASTDAAIGVQREVGQDFSTVPTDRVLEPEKTDGHSVEPSQITEPPTPVAVSDIETVAFDPQGKWNQAFGVVKAANAFKSSVNGGSSEPVEVAGESVTPMTATEVEDAAFDPKGKWSKAFGVVRAANAFKSSESQARTEAQRVAGEVVTTAIATDPKEAKFNPSKEWNVAFKAVRGTNALMSRAEEVDGDQAIAMPETFEPAAQAEKAQPIATSSDQRSASTSKWINALNVVRVANSIATIKKEAVPEDAQVAFSADMPRTDDSKDRGFASGVATAGAGDGAEGSFHPFSKWNVAFNAVRGVNAFKSGAETTKTSEFDEPSSSTKGLEPVTSTGNTEAVHAPSEERPAGPSKWNAAFNVVRAANTFAAGGRKAESEESQSETAVDSATVPIGGGEVPLRTTDPTEEAFADFVATRSSFIESGAVDVPTDNQEADESETSESVSESTYATFAGESVGTSTSVSPSGVGRKLNASVNAIRAVQSMRRRESEQKSSEAMQLIMKHKNFLEEGIDDAENDGENASLPESAKSRTVSSVPSTPMIEEGDEDEDEGGGGGEEDEDDSSFASGTMESLASSGSLQSFGGDSFDRSSVILDATIKNSVRAMQAKRREKKSSPPKLKQMIQKHSAFFRSDDEYGDGETPPRKGARSISQIAGALSERDSTDADTEDLPIPDNINTTVFSKAFAKKSGSKFSKAINTIRAMQAMRRMANASRELAHQELSSSLVSGESGDSFAVDSAETDEVAVADNGRSPVEPDQLIALSSDPDASANERPSLSTEAGVPHAAVTSAPVSRSVPSEKMTVANSGLSENDTVAPPRLTAPTMIAPTHEVDVSPLVSHSLNEVTDKTSKGVDLDSGDTAAVSAPVAGTDEDEERAAASPRSPGVFGRVVASSVDPFGACDSENEDDYEVCHFCGIVDSIPVEELISCPICKDVVYCSPYCLKSDRVNHIDECVRRRDSILSLPMPTAARDWIEAEENAPSVTETASIASATEQDNHQEETPIVADKEETDDTSPPTEQNSELGSISDDVEESRVAPVEMAKAASLDAEAKPGPTQLKASSTLTDTQETVDKQQRWIMDVRALRVQTVEKTEQRRVEPPALYVHQSSSVAAAPAVAQSVLDKSFPIDSVRVIQDKPSPIDTSISRLDAPRRSAEPAGGYVHQDSSHADDSKTDLTLDDLKSPDSSENDSESTTSSLEESIDIRSINLYGYQSGDDAQSLQSLHSNLSGSTGNKSLEISMLAKSMYDIGANWNDGNVSRSSFKSLPTNFSRRGSLEHSRAQRRSVLERSKKAPVLSWFGPVKKNKKDSMATVSERIQAYKDFVKTYKGHAGKRTSSEARESRKEALRELGRSQSSGVRRAPKRLDVV